MESSASKAQKFDTSGGAGPDSVTETRRSRMSPRLRRFCGQPDRRRPRRRKSSGVRPLRM